jgi:cytochrome P450
MSSPDGFEVEDTEAFIREYDQHNPVTTPDGYPSDAVFRESSLLARSERYGGFWILSRYDEVNAAARDHESFSSRQLDIPNPESLIMMPPLDQDPPAHTRYRQLLLPFFTPKRAALVEPFARESARELAATIAGQKSCDVVHDYALPLPALVLAHIMGIDPSDTATFAEWLVTMMEGGPGAEGTGAVHVKIYEYLTSAIAERRNSPKDDLLTYLATAEVDGRPLTDEERLGISFLLFIAGIDTTANTLGAALWYLGKQPSEAGRLRQEPSLMTGAIEEFLRMFAPVTVTRVARKPVEVRGCPVATDDQVMLLFPSANRDDQAFPDAQSLKFDRSPNPHVAFGAGVHRCLGLHFARMELRTGLEEFLMAIPEFKLADPASVEWKTGPNRGPREVKVVLPG